MQTNGFNLPEWFFLLFIICYSHMHDDDDERKVSTKELSNRRYRGLCVIISTTIFNYRLLLIMIIHPNI